MGEVEERAGPLFAGAGEARAAGGSGGRVRNDSSRPPEAQERAMRAPVGRPPGTACRAGAPLEARGPGAAPGRRRKLERRRSRSASFLLSINPAPLRSGRRFWARFPHRMVRG